MKIRALSGVILVFVGLLIMFFASFSGRVGFLVSLIYSLPLIVFGIIIIFNKKEDKIEEINYSKIKKGGRSNGKK